MIDYTARRTVIREHMARRGIDLLAVWPSENMTYLLGWHSHPDERPCFFLLTPRGEAMLMPELNAEEARAHLNVSMETYADAEGPAEALRRLGAQLHFGDVDVVALDETMRTDFSLLLLEHLDDARPLAATELIGGVRMLKEDVEVELIQQNAATADRAMQAAFASIRPGVSERDIGQAARQAYEEVGVDKVNFTIVGAGPNGAFPHHATSRKRVEEGDAIVIDIGARKDGYNSDVTRMAFVGTPSQHYLEVHAVVEQAVQAALGVIRPGLAAREVDRAARDVITAAGYGEYFVHRTGHGLGLNGHEPPYITSTNELALEKGMVFSVEPGIYLPGEFGVRLEEIVVVTEDGARIFNGLPREVFVAEAR